MLLSITRGFLNGILSAKVSANNMRKLLSFLKDRLGNQAIELTIEVDGKKIEIKAASRAELEMAIQEIQELIDKTA